GRSCTSISMRGARGRDGGRTADITEAERLHNAVSTTTEWEQGDEQSPHCWQGREQNGTEQYENEPILAVGAGIRSGERTASQLHFTTFVCEPSTAAARRKTGGCRNHGAVPTGGAFG